MTMVEIEISCTDTGRLIAKATVDASPRSGLLMVAACDDDVNWIIPMPADPMDDNKTAGYAVASVVRILRRAQNGPGKPASDHTGTRPGDAYAGPSAV